MAAPALFKNKASVVLVTFGTGDVRTLSALTLRRLAALPTISVGR